MFWFYVIYGDFSNVYQKYFSNGEIIMLVFFAGYMVQELVEAAGSRGGYFEEGWNMLVRGCIYWQHRCYCLE